MTVLGNNEHIIKKKNVDYYGCLKDPFVVFQPLQSGKGVEKKKVPLGTWMTRKNNQKKNGIPQELGTIVYLFQNAEYR